MNDVYRTPAERSRPVCTHCGTARWLIYGAMFDVWVCDVCHEWVDPYWYLDEQEGREK